jgi:hypothetical protein
MARLILRALAVAALLLGSTAAMAEPVTAFLATTLFTVGGVAVSVGAALYFAATVASTIYGSIQTKKKARAAQQRAAEIEAASLKDRTTTLLTADSPWPVIYGQPAPVGGSIVAMLTSGDADQFKHVVYVLASHECTGVDEIFIAGESVGPIDGNGYAGSPLFGLEDGVPRVETHPFVLAQMSDGEDGIGYAALPVGLDADNFALISVLDEAGNDYGPGFEATTVSPFGFGGWALKGPVGAKGTVTYRVNGPGSALNLQIHLSPGGVDTADVFLRAARPDLWTADHKLSGYTYIVVTMNLLLERFQGGVPEITARVRGKKVYDYRTGQTVYSRNPALCLADFIRSETGYGASLAQIEVDSVIAAANACDVAVYDSSVVNADPATFGFSVTRYTCDGMFRSDQDRDATRQQIEDAMVGFSLESGGVWRIQAGAWSTPVLALTDDDMVMPMSVVQTGNNGTARYNGCKGTYVNATRLGVTEDFMPYVNPVFRALDVKDKFHETTLSFTGNHIRTQQISRVIVEQSRGGFVVQVFPKMFAWNLQPGDRIVLSSALYAFDNKTFRVQDWTYQAGTPVALQCVEDEEAFYDQVDETRADAAPNTQLPSPFLKPAPPLDLLVLSGEAQMAQQGGVMVLRAKVTWAQSPDPMVRLSGSVRVQWREAADGGAWQSQDIPGDSTEIYLLGLVQHRVYVVRVAFLTPYTSSAWSVYQHEMLGLEGLPDSVVGFDVRTELTGNFGYWQEPAGTDLLGWSATQIRRGPTWLLAESFILFDGRASSANLGWFPAGLQAVWAAHHNTVGEWSTPVFDTIEILNPDQPIPVYDISKSGQVVIRWADCKTTQPIDYYEIRRGPVFPSAEIIAREKSTTTSVIQKEFGETMYWVVAVDVGGNRGPQGYVAALTLESYDSTIGSIRGKVDSALEEVLALQLQALLDGQEQLQRVRAGVYEKIEIVKNENDASVKKFTAIAAAVDEYQAIVSSQLTAAASAGAANASRTDVIAAVTATNTAAIVDEREARVTAVGAVATQVTTVQSSVSTLSGTVQIQSNTLANLNGNVAAQHMIRTEVVSGMGIRAIAGLSIGVSSTGGGTAVQSKVAVFADEFVVLPDATATSADPPFRVENGVVHINTAFIKDASIGTLMLAGQAVTVPAFLSGQTNDLSMNFVISGSGVYQVFILASMVMSQVGTFQLFVDGNSVYLEAASGGTLACKGWALPLAAGVHTIRIYSDKPNTNGASIYALATKR